MFPARVKELSGSSPQLKRSEDFSLDDEKGKRICHPDYFPVYFRFEVPESIFSSLEMESLKDEMRSVASDAERRTIFTRNFVALEKDSLRRYDFVNKLGFEVETLSLEVAQSVALALAANSETLGNAFLVNEGRRALAGVFAVAQRLSDSERINAFICECIATAGADLFAADLCRFMTVLRDKNKVVLNFTYVQNSAIEAAFAERMDRKYGLNAKTDQIVVSTLWIHAFWIWASINSAERDKVTSFWIRHIGGSRRRLAEAFDVIAPAGTIWTKDSPAYIDLLIPTATLKSMYADFPVDEKLEQLHENALIRLRKFLNGELREGELLDSAPGGGAN